MSRVMRFVPGFAAMLLLAAPVAQAQGGARCPATSCAAPRVGALTSVVRQAEQVKLSVKDAIAIAERHGGGKVVQASLLVQGGRASYTVVALPNASEVWRGQVDATSGAITGQRLTPVADAAALDLIDPIKARLAEQMQLPLPQAVARAEARSGGRVFDASLQNANGRATYEMQVARGDDVEDLVVNPANGAVTLAD